MAADSMDEFSAVSKESAMLIPTAKEETQLSKKEIIALAIGYASLVFMGLSLLFPIWADNTLGSTNFISLWRMNLLSGPLATSPAYHWEILWYFRDYIPYIFLSILFLSVLLETIVLITKSIWTAVRNDWQKPKVRTSPFIIAILLGAVVVVASFVFPEFDIYSHGLPGIYTVIYGPSWGLSFGWYSMLLAGLLGIITQRIYEDIEKAKEEEKEGYLA
jgi:hypothetical protein